MNKLILELKICCGQDKFYGRSKFGQYDEVKDRAPLFIYTTGSSHIIDDCSRAVCFCQSLIGL